MIHTQHALARTPSNKYFPATCYVILVLLMACTILRPGSTHAALFDSSKGSWALLGGYGQSIPGLGKTSQRVETIDLVGRYTHLIFDDLGSGWNQGFSSIHLELPFHFVVSPDDSTMIGLNVLVSYTFTANDNWRPYIFGGGGPVYSFADIPGMGSDWNANYQFGCGLGYKLNPEHELLFEYRFHHISNAGTKYPNVPLDSCKFLIGITF